MPTRTKNLVLLVGNYQKGLAQLYTRLGQAGYRVRKADSAPAAWRCVIQDSPYAVVVDEPFSPVPARTLNLCRELAEDGHFLVVVLIHRGDTRRDRVAALSYGVDQCFTMPGSFKELVAFLNARKSGLRHTVPDQMTQAGQVSILKLDPANRRVYRNGHAIGLSQLEFALLVFLARQSGRIVPSSKISQSLWQTCEESTRRNLLKQYVCLLRRKIEPDPHHPIHLENARGLGYRLRLAVQGDRDT